MVSVISCTSANQTELLLTETSSPTIAPTHAQIPPTLTSTPTLVPTNTATPTPTMPPEPTSTYAPVVPIGELPGKVFFRICYILGFLDENNKPEEPCPIVLPENLSGAYRDKFIAFTLDYNWPLGYGIVRSDVQESPFCDYDFDGKESSCGDRGLLLFDLVVEEDMEGEPISWGSEVYDRSLDSYLGGEYFLIEVERKTVDSFVPWGTVDNYRGLGLKDYVLQQMVFLWPLTSDQFDVLIDELRLYGMDWILNYE